MTLIAQNNGFGRKMKIVERIFAIEKSVWAMGNAVSFKQNENRSWITT